MLRILKDGKPVSLKEQEKLVGEKGSIENVGPKYDPKERPAPTTRMNKHAGLRSIGGKSESKTDGEKSKGKSSKTSK